MFQEGREEKIQIAKRSLFKQTKMIIESDGERSIVDVFPLTNGWDTIVYLPKDPHLTGGTQARVIEIRPYRPT